MTEKSAGDESVNFSGVTPGNPLIRSAQVQAKAEVSRNATKRIQAYQRALRHLPAVEQARRELELEFEEKGYIKQVGDGALAKRLAVRA